MTVTIQDPQELAVRAGGLTPFGGTTVTFDIAENNLVEPFICHRREAAQMRPDRKDVIDCIRLKSGPWILRPVQGVGLAHEDSDSHAYTLRLSAFSAASSVVEVPHSRVYSELPDIGSGGGVATTGDYFLTKRIAAGATWQNVISGPLPLNDELAGDLNYPLDHLVRSIATHDAMTGYLVKLWAPGGVMSTPDWAFAFEFGGELYGPGTTPHSGFGRFQLGISGNGQMVLYERVDEEWQEVGRWRGFEFGELLSQGVLVWIFPAWPSHLEIATTLAMEENVTLIELLTYVAELAILAGRGDFRLSTFVYHTTNRGDQAVANGPGYLAPITGPGQCSFWMRRDLRGLFQINRIGYVDEGVIQDKAMTLRAGVLDAHIVRANLRGYNFIDDEAEGAQTELEAELEGWDGTAGTPLAPATESITWKGAGVTLSGWNPPGGENRIRAVINLRTLQAEGSRFHTPFLTGYTVLRNAHIATHAPGEKTGGTVTAVSIMGPSYEPDHESATVEIEDTTNALSFLRARGRASVRIESTFDSGGVNKAIWYEGYTGRVTSALKGKRNTVYPGANWHNLDVQCVGKWDKLADRYFYDLISFQFDRDSPSGQTSNKSQTWKITDILRFVLATNGVPESEMDIADLDLRIFAPNGREAVGTVMVMPGMSVTEYLQTLLRDYLGGWLLYEPNAGASGMWRLRLPPTATTLPVWNFVTSAPSAGAKLTHRAGAYAANTSPILGPTPLRSYVVPPEGNVLHVVGGADPKTGEVVRRTLINPTSWDSPTSAIADDTDLDYLGRIVEIFYIAPEMSSREAVDFVARRVFSSALRGRRFVEMEAEAILLDVVTPGGPAYEPTIFTVRQRRPIRPGDLVTVDAVKYVAHGVSPMWRNDMAQKAFYELELYREGILFAQ